MYSSGPASLVVVLDTTLSFALIYWNDAILIPAFKILLTSSNAANLLIIVSHVSKVDVTFFSAIHKETININPKRRSRGWMRGRRLLCVRGITSTLVVRIGRRNINNWKSDLNEDTREKSPTSQNPG